MKKTINQKKGANMEKVDTTIYALVTQKDGSWKRIALKEYRKQLRKKKEVA